jgi:hypothetical protein
MTLLIVPVVLGQGTRLFPGTGPDMALDLAGSRADSKGVTIQVYRPRGARSMPPASRARPRVSISRRRARRPCSGDGNQIQPDTCIRSSASDDPRRSAVGRFSRLGVQSHLICMPQDADRHDAAIGADRVSLVKWCSAQTTVRDGSAVASHAGCRLCAWAQVAEAGHRQCSEHRVLRGQPSASATAELAQIGSAGAGLSPAGQQEGPATEALTPASPGSLPPPGGSDRRRAILALSVRRCLVGSGQSETLRRLPAPQLQNRLLPCR